MVRDIVLVVVLSLILGISIGTGAIWHSDMHLHIVMSAVLMGFFWFFFRNIFVAIVCTLAVGFCKEMYDPVFTSYDMVANMIGTFVSAFILEIIDDD